MLFSQPKIFISYRRSDSGGYAGRLFESLAQKFGEQNVFIDVHGIEPGKKFPEVIAHTLSNCNVFLLLIGTEWLKTADVNGTPRISNPDDFVRMELLTALRSGISIIPVLVNGAEMPGKNALDKELDFSSYNGVTLNNIQWKYDTDKIITSINKITRPSDRQISKKTIALFLIVAIVLSLGFVWWKRTAKEEPVSPLPGNATEGKAKADSLKVSKLMPDSQFTSHRPLDAPAKPAPALSFDNDHKFKDVLSNIENAFIADDPSKLKGIRHLSPHQTMPVYSMEEPLVYFDEQFMINFKDEKWLYVASKKFTPEQDDEVINKYGEYLRNLILAHGAAAGWTENKHTIALKNSAVLLQLEQNKVKVLLTYLAESDENRSIGLTVFNFDTKVTP